MIFTPSFVALMNEVPAEKRGAASGITATLRQFSSSVGLALFGSVYASMYSGHFAQFLQKNPSTAELTPQLFEGILSESPQALTNMGALSPTEAQYILESAKMSFLDGFSRINLIGALIAFSSMLIAWRMLKNVPIHREKKPQTSKSERT